MQYSRNQESPVFRPGECQGNLIVNGKFNAKSKSYYKRARNIFGSKLVIEKLENGVDMGVKQND